MENESIKPQLEGDHQGHDENGWYHRRMVGALCAIAATLERIERALVTRPIAPDGDAVLIDVLGEAPRVLATRASDAASSSGSTES